MADEGGPFRESSSVRQVHTGPANFLRPRRKRRLSNADEESLQPSCSKSSSSSSGGEIDQIEGPSDDEGAEGDEDGKPNKDGLFVIDRVLAKKRVDDCNYYYIKWAGWPYKHSDWEPEVHIICPGDPMEAFEEREKDLSVIMKNPSVRCADDRLYQLRNLTRWERKINDYFDDDRVFVYNDVDKTQRPRHFEYILKNVVSEKIKKPMKGKLKKQCGCPSKNFRNGFPILPDSGSVYKLAIARTEHCGWGVFALEDIPESRFVFEFLGELLTIEEADAHSDIDYQFELNCNDNAEYVLDAKHVGNESAFMNHSCQPNMRAVVIFDEDANPSFHRMAFFSKTKISKGDELTLDYYPEKRKGDKVDKKSSTLTKCLCNKKPCIKYFSLED